jgi:large subunit ribosomal protein L10
LKLKGGIIEGEIYDSKEIVEIANLPPKDVLLSKLLGSLNSPLTRLVYSLKWPINQLVWTLNAVKEEKEKNLEQ